MLLSSASDDHHFGRFDQSVNQGSLLKTKRFRGVAGNYGSDRLPTDINCHLNQQALCAKCGDNSAQLIAPADGIETDGLFALFRSAGYSFNFAASNSMMPARSPG